MAMWPAEIGSKLVKNEGGKWRGYAVVGGRMVKREEQRRMARGSRGVVMLQLQGARKKSWEVLLVAGSDNVSSGTQSFMCFPDH